MADISDVANTLVGQVAAGLYPNGTSQPSTIGQGVKIYAGWPLPAQLDADLKAAITHVSVWPRDEESNTSRYSTDWQQVDVPAATLNAAVAGQTVTFSGAAAAGMNIAVLANGQSFTYAVQAGDTLATVATALATAIAAAVPGTTSSGAVLTLPGSADLQAARIGVTATMIRELRRQQRLCQISVWASTPDARDALAKAVDAVLAPLVFLTMPDGSSGRIKFKSSRQVDVQQKEGYYRRDILYTVEYATTQTTPATQVVTQQFNVTAQDSNQAQIGAAQINL